ncbi:MAG: tetratricopeptide repeat protein, partial [Planctomycetota bacterium]
NQGQAAIKVFEFNVKKFPRSWNAYDSLGEACAATGNSERAIENYRQSIKLNPKNEAGRARLDELLKSDASTQ